MFPAPSCEAPLFKPRIFSLFTPTSSPPLPREDRVGAIGAATIGVGGIGADAEDEDARSAGAEAGKVFALQFGEE